MAISITLNEYLSQHHINYELVKHRRTTSSLDSSFSAHLPTTQVAKAVILQSKDGEYLMATLPAGHRLSISDVNNLMGKEYQLVNEWSLHELFPDCEQGAIPGIGDAYNMKMMIDDTLLDAEQIYIEAGDHRYLVKIDSNQYKKMMSAIPHAKICGQAIGTPDFVESLSSKWSQS
ncbi:MAG: YbaK/EbsC family protein [Psychromonas sp.]|nr:YbaK/EbsC family protein [Psychromonas sp.]MCW8994182.1 YbaK/EbsC family protein [Psychromonas sp.]